MHLTILCLLGRIYFKNRSVRKVLDGKTARRKNRTICIVKPPKPDGFGGNSGCGGRTRTYDLRVMSPTSFQLLYSAIFRWRLILRYYSTKAGICQQVFSSGILSHLRAFCPVPVSWGRLARIRVRGRLYVARGKSRQELSAPLPGSSPCSRIFACCGCGGMCFKERVKYVFQKYFKICVKTY